MERYESHVRVQSLLAPRKKAPRQRITSIITTALLTPYRLSTRPHHAHTQIDKSHGTNNSGRGRSTSSSNNATMAETNARVQDMPEQEEKEKQEGAFIQSHVSGNGTCVCSAARTTRGGGEEEAGGGGSGDVLCARPCMLWLWSSSPHSPSSLHSPPPHNR